MEKIFEKIIRITEGNISEHISVAFEIKRNFEKIKISTSYEPKYEYNEQKCLQLLEKSAIEQAPNQLFSCDDLKHFIPLKNHISWSIDSPERFLGTKHLSAQYQTHFISKHGSSCGFLPCEIEKGIWKITASINGIFTEFCDISLLVEGE